MDYTIKRATSIPPLKVYVLSDTEGRELGMVRAKGRAPWTAMTPKGLLSSGYPTRANAIDAIVRDYDD